MVKPIPCFNNYEYNLQKTKNCRRKQKCYVYVKYFMYSNTNSITVSITLSIDSIYILYI